MIRIVMMTIIIVIIIIIIYCNQNFTSNFKSTGLMYFDVFLYMCRLYANIKCSALACLFWIYFDAWQVQLGSGTFLTSKLRTYIQ